MRNRKKTTDKPVKWTVTLPITGVVYVEVTASSRDEAIEKALRGDDLPDGYPDPEWWEIHEAICTGNVFHGMLNEADAEPAE